MKLCLIFVSSALLYTKAKFKHRDLGLTLCSDTEKEEMYGLDGEEKWHADFSEGKGVMTLPDFADPTSFEEGYYEMAVANVDICKQNLASCVKAYHYPAEPKVAPQTSVYSKDDVELGSRNTLICHLTGFYPSRVGVSWTKNNVNVTDGVTLSRRYPNYDGTFNLVSRLSFTPEEGDIYACTVEHTALDRPLTKTWDVQDTLPGVGLSVYCGVGLAAGVLGVAAGTFFLVKGNNFN
ncbi:H-2 class II histocompatibility antigen, A-Q alpha chain-like [Pygocentrus nattereri]|uniref:Ig-like domain-containing protein n=1 Tax=Pygocentrus nattereri TaxID=42514 RepID=A0A3B4C6G3_PYGNA|nr:H-2 class II histocompatibility antigen, A-Q alpha chain-like [Pygocentrus nattereri]